MSFNKWLAAAAWVFMPLAAAAPQEQPSSHAAHAANAAPPAAADAGVYTSAFQNYRASRDADHGQTPDQRWRTANEEVARLGGHGGHMKDSADQHAGTGELPKATEAANGAAGHGKHH